MALALWEHFSGEKYSLIPMEGWADKHARVRFGKWNIGNPFRVSDRIEWSGTVLGALHPPVYISHSKEMAVFVANFDKGLPVKPFSFDIELPFDIEAEKKYAEQMQHKLNRGI